LRPVMGDEGVLVVEVRHILPTHHFGLDFP
jgi:hypothetical protein